jgi:hypothetical protein
MDELRKILSEEELKQIELNDEDKNYYVFTREKRTTVSATVVHDAGNVRS